MLDLLMLIMFATAFAAAFGYVWACHAMTARRSPGPGEAP
jgi:hypothetical protein